MIRFGKPVLNAWLAVGLCLLASACSRNVTSSPNDPSNLENWVAEVKGKPPPPLEPLPPMQQFETFVYNAQDLRDPFSSAFQGPLGPGLRPDPGRRRQALEEFPIDSLRMLGSIRAGGGAMRGLIQSPDKKSHQVGVGSYMGQNNGRVTSITESRIELVELVPDGAGGWEEREAAITVEETKK